LTYSKKITGAGNEYDECRGQTAVCSGGVGTPMTSTITFKAKNSVPASENAEVVS